jgi:replicative DNA helicase
MVDEQDRFREDRAPSFDLSAEMGVLGSLLLNPAVATDIKFDVSAEDFYDDANRKVYAAIMGMFDSRRHMDVTILVSELKITGDYEIIGGAGYLAKLANSVPNAAEAKYYAQMVRSKANIRRLGR